MFKIAMAALVMFPCAALAQTPPEAPGPSPSLLVDANADGRLQVVGFGDSLTRGVGDFIAAGETVEPGSIPPLDREAGYPLRIEGLLGVGVTNAGVPGEVSSTDGIRRYASNIPATHPDVVVIGGGANDAIRGIAPGTVYNALQTMVNIAFAVGATPIVVTIARPCCDHAGYAAAIDMYNQQTRRMAQINAIRLADFDRGFANGCRGESGCHLLNQPEGLHPNIEGYDIAGEIVSGQLMGIDILTAGGAAQLETALNLAPGTIRTVPNAASSAQP